MNKTMINILTIVSILGGGAVFAADRGSVSNDKPHKNWGGFYVGGNIGGAWGRADWTYQNANPYDAFGPEEPIIDATNQFNMGNVAGGAQIGFNYQLGNFVLGPEADFIWSHLERKTLNGAQIFIPFTSSIQTVSTSIHSFSTVTGRAGVLVKPNWLVYGRGGYVNTVIHTKGVTSPPIEEFELNWNTAERHSGWVAGAGVEYRLIQNLNIGVEYNYIGLNNVVHIATVPIVSGNQIVHQVNANIQNVMARFTLLLGP